ncbi:MAG TPA: hypothetical protein DC006_05125 [Prevotellaceae bacterium]|nr:hypothetical protein [Prevotellaceae bacterium]
MTRLVTRVSASIRKLFFLIFICFCTLFEISWQIHPSGYTFAVIYAADPVWLLYYLQIDAYVEARLYI